MRDHQTRFVIFGIQRTGTTLLVGFLDAHPEIMCLGELFQNRRGLVGHSRQRYRSYTEGSVARRLGHLVAPRALMEEYMQAVAGSQGHRVVGFKLMFVQTRRHPRVLDLIREHRYKVLHVVRENFLKTAVSRVRARETGVYASRDPVANLKVRLPPVSLTAELAKVSREHRALERLVAGLGLDHIVIAYEQLAGKHRRSELARVWAFLNVASSVTPMPELSKLTSDDLSQAVENYDEIALALRHTEYERFL